MHIINWSSTRKTPQHPEVHEDPVPLSDIRIKLNIPLNNVTVKTVFSEEKLIHRRVSSGIEVTVPKIAVNEILSFDA